MRPRVRVYRCPKRGLDFSWYEDAFAVDSTRQRFVVTDGASRGSYSALWARLVANAFTQQQFERIAANEIAFGEWLQAAREMWRQSVPWERLDYFARKHAEQGTGCTLVGAAIEYSTGSLLEPVAWHGAAVGDACLFHFTEGGSMRMLPALSEDQFLSPPYLIGTDGRRNVDLHQQILVESGPLATGDILALCTDRISLWLLRNQHSAREWLITLLGEPRGIARETFKRRVADERENGSLPDDDVTMLLIAIL